MKTFIACLGTESNSFSPIPTGEQAFRETLLHHGDATRYPETLFSAPLQVWRGMAEARGGEVIESLCAFAQPGAPTVGAVYEAFRDEILGDLAAALPVDMVLLSLHGAMIAEGYDDCEGDLIERVRTILGPDLPIGVELDLHCHVTAKMLAGATAIVTFKEYPHVDAALRAQEVFSICEAVHLGRVKPHIAVYDCRMLSLWRTPVEPTRGFVDRMAEIEGAGRVLSVSFAHGFPWGDVANIGAKMLVITDDAPEAGAEIAERLGRELWEMRDETAPQHLTIDAALDRALEIDGGPVVLADVSDNAGGGAPSDATFLLERVIARGVQGVASCAHWDPVAVRLCMEAGEGARFRLRVGGKCGALSGAPLDLDVTVRKTVADATQSFGTATAAMGDTAWVSASGVDLVLNTVRTQTFNPDAMTNLGLDPRTHKVVIVKSAQHFHAGFAPIAREIIYVAGPGVVAPDFAEIPLTKLDRPLWPRVAGPFEAQALAAD